MILLVITSCKTNSKANSKTIILKNEDWSNWKRKQ